MKRGAPLKGSRRPHAVTGCNVGRDELGTLRVAGSAAAVALPPTGEARANAEVEGDERAVAGELAREHGMWPDRFMSPRRTLNSCGSSPSDVGRRRCANGMIRGSCSAGSLKSLAR